MRTLAILLALFLVLATSGAAYGDAGDEATAYNFDMASGQTGPSGITWTGTQYLVTSSVTTTAYAYTATGAYNSTNNVTFDSAATSIMGITADDTTTWVVSTSTDKVYYTGGTTSSFALATANTMPSGITHDSTYLYVVDKGDDKVFAYTIAGVYTPSKNFTLATANTSPSGITHTGTQFAVSDNGTDSVYIYSLTGAAVAAEAFDMDTNNSVGYGIAYRDTRFLVVDYNDTYVYAYQSASTAAALALTSVELRSVGRTTMQAVLTADVTTTLTIYSRHRPAGGAWVEQASVDITTSPYSYSIGSVTDGTTYNLEVSASSTYTTPVSASLTHEGTTLLILDTDDEEMWEITNISDVAGSNSDIGDMPGPLNETRSMEEMDGWVWIVDSDSHGLWRSRTPLATSSFVLVGTMPAEGSNANVTSLVSINGDLWRINADGNHLTRIVGRTTTSPTHANSHTYSGVGQLQAAAHRNGILYLFTTSSMLRVPDITAPGTYTTHSFVGTLSHIRGAALFNDRIIVTEEDNKQIWEITDPDGTPTPVLLGTYSSNLRYGASATHWHHHPATIVSSVTNGTITDTTAVVGVTLTAAVATGDTTYVRYRASSTADPWVTASATGQTGTSVDVSISALTAGASYEYQASTDSNFPADDRAASSFATSAPAPTAPGVPRTLSATPADAALNLAWTAPLSNGGAQISDYEYCTLTDCSTNNAWESLATNGVSATISQTSSGQPLANGTAVNVRIRAVNSSGAGSATTAVTATPRAPSAPAAPTGFTATAGASQVVLGWTAPAVDHDETITRYEYSSDNGGSWRTTGSTSTDYTATQTSASSPAIFTLGTAYVFRVRAVNGVGNGAASGNATATPYGVPSAPSSLVGSAGDQSVSLSWAASSANGLPITRYEYSSNNGGSWRTTGATTTSYTATQTSASSPTNLVNGTSYTFRVRAVNSHGNSTQSNSASIAPIQALTSAELRSVGSTTMQAVVTANVGTSLTIYTRYRPAGGAWVEQAGVSITSSPYSYSIGSVTDGTTYNLEVSTSSTYTSPVSASHAHVGTTLLLWDLVASSTDVWEVTNISDVPGSDSRIGALPGGLANSRAVEELDGWFYGIHNSDRSIWRSRTPKVMSSYTNLGTLPTSAGNTHSLFVHGGNLWGMTSQDIYQIPTPTDPSSVTDQQRVANNITVSRGAASIGDHLYIWDHDGLEFCRVTVASVPGSGNDADCYSPGITNFQARASTVFNGRVLLNDEGRTSIYEITAPNSTAPVAVLVGAYDSAADLVNAMGSWSGHPATIVSSVANGTITDTTAVVGVTLTAAVATGDTTYVRYRASSTADPWVTASATGQTGTSVDVSISALTAGASYEYQASTDSNFPADDRAASSFATSGAPAPTAPGVPRTLSATPADAALNLAWTAPLSNGGAQISDYEYCTLTDCSTNNAWESLATNGVSATISQTSSGQPLANGTAVNVRIRAVNSSGAGSATTAVTATPRAPSAPAAPTGFTATAGASQVVLGWTAPAVDHDETITRYEYSSDNGGSWRTTGSTSTDYTATQTSASSPAIFTLGTAYVFRVRAVNGVGNGAASGNATATPYGVPSAPSSLVGSAGDQSVSLSWAASSANGLPITRYEYSSNNGGSWRTTGATTTSYTATQTSASSPTNLVNGTSYTFRVRAVNSHGNSAQSNSASIAPTDNTTPGAPGSFTITPGNNSLILGWVAPGDGGQTITSYEYCTSANCSSSGTWRAIGTSSPATITQTSDQSSNLTNNTAYSVSLRARNSIGVGPSAGPVSGTPRVPPTIDSLAASSITPTTVVLTATLDNQYSQSITVEGRWKLAEGSLWTTLASTTTTTETVQWNVTGLTSNTEYNAQAAKTSAFSTVETATWSTSVAPATLDGAPVATPASNGAALTQPLTNPDHQSILIYSRYRTPAAGGGNWTAGPSTSAGETPATISLTELDRNTQYRVQLSTDSSVFSATHQVDFTTHQPTVTAISVGAILPISAVATLTIANSDGDIATFNVRYRIGNGPWTTSAVSTSGSSTTYSMAGLTQASQYTIQASHSTTYSVQQNFSTISNAPPAFSSSAITRQVAEDTATGGNVGAPVAATDMDMESTITYTLSGTDAGLFDIDGATGQLTVAAGTNLDYETKTSYTVTVRATDNYGAYSETTVTINVIDVATSPAAPAAPSLAAGDREIGVMWAAPNDNGIAITGYDVRYRARPTGNFITHPFVGTGTSTIISNLNSGALYQVQVRASNPEADSSWSGSASVTTHQRASEQARYTCATAIGFTVGQGSGADSDLYGYSVNPDYGSGLTGFGQFPGILFADGLPRYIDGFYEDDDGWLHLEHATQVDQNFGASTWLDDMEVRIRFEGEGEERFLLSYWVKSTGAVTMAIAPPVTARSWDTHLDDAITIRFCEVNAITGAAASPGTAVADPTVVAGSFAEMLNNMPGGPITAQMIITAIVFMALLIKWPGSDPRKPIVLLGSLITTPWIPAAFDVGSLQLAVGISLTLVLGAFGWRVVARPAR